MLPKRRRLTAQEVRDVLKHGRGARAGHLSMKYLTHTGPLRVSVVVPKATARGAVERNRLRRAVYRALPCTLLGKEGGRAVVFVHHIPKERLTPAFARDVKALFV